MAPDVSTKPRVRYLVKHAHFAILLIGLSKHSSTIIDPFMALLGKRRRDDTWHLVEMLPCRASFEIRPRCPEHLPFPAPNAGQTSVAICITVCAKAFDLLVHIVWQFSAHRMFIGDFILRLAPVTTTNIKPNRNRGLQGGPMTALCSDCIE